MTIILPYHNNIYCIFAYICIFFLSTTICSNMTCDTIIGVIVTYGLKFRLSSSYLRCWRILSLVCPSYWMVWLRKIRQHTAVIYFISLIPLLMYNSFYCVSENSFIFIQCPQSKIIWCIPLCKLDRRESDNSIMKLSYCSGKMMS